MTPNPAARPGRCERTDRAVHATRARSLEIQLDALRFVADDELATLEGAPVLDVDDERLFCGRFVDAIPPSGERKDGPRG